jgi:hypothetical protein
VGHELTPEAAEGLVFANWVLMDQLLPLVLPVAFGVTGVAEATARLREMHREVEPEFDEEEILRKLGIERPGELS